MKRVRHDKLVRDRIPEYLEGKGIKAVSKQVEPDEHRQHLVDKFLEELEEYRESGDVVELADLLEVLRGMAHHEGYTLEEVLELADQKSEERGGFFNGVYLVETLEPTTSD